MHCGSQTVGQYRRCLTAGIVTLSGILFSACGGYAPLYQTSDTQEGSFARDQVMVVRVATLHADLGPGERRVAQLVGQELRQEFPHVGDVLDHLEVSIEERTTTLAVRQDATVERSQVTLSGKVTLFNPDGKEIWRTSVSSRAAYNVEDTPFSTESGRLFAQRTAANQLANEIVQVVHIFYRRHAEQAAQTNAPAR